MESLSWMFRLVDAMSGPAGKISKSLDGVSGKLKQGGVSLKGIGSKMADFASMAEPAIEVAQQIGQAIVGLAEKAFDFGKFVVEAAEFKRHTVAALTIIEGNAGVANDTLKTLQAMSNNAGIKTDDVIALYQKLRAAGFAARQAQDIIAGGLDVKAVFGGESGNAAIEAMKNIKNLGSFQGKTIKPILKQANIPLDELKKQLAKMKGLTVAQVSAMMDAGKISADEGVSAILATIQKKFDKGGPLGSSAKSLIGDSVGGQVEVFKNQLGMLFEDSTLGLPIKNALKTINSLLSEDSATGKKLRQILASALGAVTDLITSLLSDDNVSAAFDAILGVADFIEKGVEKVWPYLEALGGPLWEGIKDVVTPLIGLFKNFFNGKGADPKVLTGLRELGRALGWLIGLVIDVIGWAVAMSAVFIGVVFDAVGYLIDGFKEMSEGIRDGYYEVVAFFGDIGDALSDFVDDALDIGSDFIDGLIQGIEDGWDSVVETVTNLADAVVTTITKKLGIASPSKVMAQMGMFTALGFSQGMNDNADVVQASAGALVGGAITGASIGSFAAANGGGGGPSISLGDIHVHVPEGTTDPQAFGRAVGAEIRTEIFAALEDLGFETGEPKAA